MTSCLLVKAPRRIVAVADGRLSYGATQQSFERAQKIRRFSPVYRIPKVSMSRFSHYADYTGEDCYIAYAGTYALVAEVLEVFRTRITEALILVWRDGHPTFSESFDENAQFLDDYEFRASELPQITPQLLKEEFREAAQEKIDEFCSLRGIAADCEFLLFGKSPDRRYYAFRVTVSPTWSIGQPVQLDIQPIADGAMAAIGSTEVSGAAFEDLTLQEGLTGWTIDEEEAAFQGAFSDFDLEDGPSQSSTEGHGEPVSDKTWTIEQVENSFARHIRSSGDSSVGGSVTVASGRWYGPISITSIS